MLVLRLNYPEFFQALTSQYEIGKTWSDETAEV